MELIKCHLEKMYRRRISLLHMEKEVETRVSQIDTTVESTRQNINIVADIQVSKVSHRSLLSSYTIYDGGRVYTSYWDTLSLVGLLSLQLLQFGCSSVLIFAMSAGPLHLGGNF
mgnify:CR=1 FL=1